MFYGYIIDGLKTKAMAYSKEQIENIFNYIEKEIIKCRTIRTILKDDGMPAPETFYRWIIEYPDLSKQYTRAKEIQAHIMFDDILEIADDNTNDTYVNADGVELTNNDVIQRARIRIDTRKWYLSKVLPKIYGDKQQIDHTTDGEKISQPPKIIFQAPTPENE